MATMWSPAFNKWVMVEVAARPEAKVMAYLPLSKAAKQVSRASLVGLPLLLYSYLQKIEVA